MNINAVQPKMAETSLTHFPFLNRLSNFDTWHQTKKKKMKLVQAEGSEWRLSLKKKPRVHDAP